VNVCVCVFVCVWIYWVLSEDIPICVCVCVFICMCVSKGTQRARMGVATISRLLKIPGLFCRISSLL